MKKFYALAMLLCAITAFGQTLSPYLQAPTQTSIYVNWKTESNPESIVEYGASPTALTNTVTGTNNVYSDTGYPANYFYHTVKVTGLTANTKYYYRVKTGTLTSDVMSFKTLPLPGQAATADGHLRFLVLGDNQMRNVPRFDTLVAQAKRKIAQKWGITADPADNIALTVMVGDQVDVGTLDHYENVHFKKNKALSGYLPIQTLVGNHETYGTLAMQAYYDHYVLNEMTYQGISSGTENYYANQVGNVLFIAMDTEHTGGQQLNWLNQVVNAANGDATVEWIISLGHRPYQAEQYVGDISQWVRTTAMPVLTASPKHILHIGAHHHLYHRGQLKNTPTYQIISGGVAWDQYWGMAVEQDFDDVQKTISNWIYQIIDVDVVNGTFDVEAYSIGSIYNWKDNELMDTFHRRKNKPSPAQPTVTNAFTGNELPLPLTIESSPYTTTSTELLNSTQFMIGKTQDFSIIEKDIYRDYENLYGKLNNQPDVSKDQNAGVDITKLTLGANAIPNGQYYVKVRHRDRNLNWSPWSETKSFKVIGSNFAVTEIQLDTIAYLPNTPISVAFTGAPGNQTDWIGIYKRGQNPGPTPATTWSYINGQANGTKVFTNGLTTPGRYYATLMANDGYTEIAPRKEFYVGPFVTITTPQEVYQTNAAVTISFQNAPKFVKDWIGIYKVGQTPGQNGATSTKWDYVTTTSGSFTFNGIPDGYYYAEYYLEDGYTSVGNKIFFQVGSQITDLFINKTIYNLNENIIATWTDAPGIVKDWLGIYPAGADPDSDEFVSYTYFGGTATGTKTIESAALPTTPGDYFIVMFTNDSYNEVSNRVSFVVDAPAGIDEFSSANGVTVYPNPAKAGEKTYIKSKYPIQQIDMFDMTGNLFYTSKNINDYNFSIINQSLPTGVYVLKIHSNKVYTVKVMVK